MGKLSLRIRHPEDVLWARQEAVRFCAALPFRPEDLGRIEVTAAELASNMVKHAHGGRLSVTWLEREGRRGVRMVATDQGPGIANLQEAMRPGFSTAGSLGDGLAMVEESMDKVRITSEPGHGTTVEVEKWA